MALKGDRRILETDISFFFDGAASRGVVLTHLTSGSGAAMDQGRATVQLSVDPSGKVPAGLLLNDQVDIDQTRQHINHHKDEMIKGGKCCLLTKGEVVTDRISGTPTAGNKAYLTANGAVTPTISATGGIVATPLVGEFKSAKDEDGYAKVYIDITGSR